MSMIAVKNAKSRRLRVCGSVVLVGEGCMSKRRNQRKQPEIKLIHMRGDESLCTEGKTIFIG